MLGPVVQSVVSPIVGPGVVSLISAQPHTFVEIDHEILSVLLLNQEVPLSITSASMCKECWLTA